MLKFRLAGATQEDLLTSYKSMVRPLLDYTAATYHPQLTRELSEEIESFQARAMKLVFGHTVSYRTVVDNEFIETHHQRRERLVEKFARKTQANQVFSDRWFPRNPEIDCNVRNRKEFREEKAKTTRLYRSPIFHMRRVMNTRPD